MIYRCALLILFIMPCALYGQGKNIRKPIFRVATDLRVIHNDRLLVSVELPDKKLKSYRFCFPRMVPGIYGELNFGFNIDSIWVMDRKGKKIPLVRADTNTWIIP